MAIQSNDTVHSYADSIVSASNSVSSDTGTKDDGNVYQGQKGMSANIDGDKNARNRFVENRLAQVVKIARNYADRENVKKGITGMDELIAEGNVGLLEAISVIEENKKNFVENNVPNFDSIDGAIYMEVTNAIESLLDTVTSD